MIIKTPSKSYTAHDLQEILLDLGLKDGAAVHRIVAKNSAGENTTVVGKPLFFYNLAVIIV